MNLKFTVMPQSYNLRKKREKQIIENISVLRVVPSIDTAKVVEMVPKFLPNIHTTYSFPLFSGSKETCSVDGWDSK